jgi:restriction system protein
LARHFDLTEAELAELLPSGRQQLFVNRVAWAKTHLKAAGLMESPRRAHYRVTQWGRELLEDRPDRVDMRTLKSYPSYVEFRARGRKAEEGTEEITEADSQTPEEQLELAYQSIRDQLAEELLDKVKAVAPQFFERLVVELLVAMGYGGSRRDAGATLGRSGDEGVDGVVPWRLASVSSRAFVPN